MNQSIWTLAVYFIHIYIYIDMLVYEAYIKGQSKSFVYISVKKKLRVDIIENRFDKELKEEEMARCTNLNTGGKKWGVVHI